MFNNELQQLNIDYDIEIDQVEQSGNCAFAGNQRTAGRFTKADRATRSTLGLLAPDTGSVKKCGGGDMIPPFHCMQM